MSRWTRQIVIVLAVLLSLPGVAAAELEQSTSYSMNESEIGGNGQFNSSSTSYSINPNIDDGGSSLGESTVGNSASTSYQSNGGFNTTAQPGLTMVVNTGSINFGPLSSAAATFATATFDVTDYTSYGYVVQIVGSAPTYGTNTLTPLTTDTASSPGTSKQFGLNTVLNTVASQGLNPQQLPSSSFSFGVAGDGSTGTFGTNRPYTISDKYRFNSGDIIASSPKTSGDTKYTMTFLANITPTTAAGAYTGSIDIVATGTF